MRLADLRGARFDDRVTGKLDEFASLKLSTSMIDGVGKNRTPEVPIVGDVRKVLIDLLRRCQEAGECVAPDKRKSG